MTNRLASSTSPYLLQHAENLVDWYPWAEDALAKARAEDKPIFLSIGYAACHWCHVMAHESFEDRETAAIMNERFVNIKVDREERPDLDAIYMQATMAMHGSGGWPMSVFLTPDLQPFYAGTYFPPVARYNLPSFKDVLQSLASAWRDERAEILRVGGQMVEHLQPRSRAVAEGVSFTPESLDAIANAMLEAYDWDYGGWGRAPKFPQPMSLEFLLRRALQNADKREEYLKLVTHCLRAMARGGMYDVVGGGFSRYSTDNYWRVPHFEKMLYDNAQLALIYLHTWQVTGEPAFRQVAEETLGFIAREMSHPKGGFYSSLDADSEGQEGKFYVWTVDEIRQALPDPLDFDFFRAAYGLTEQGNWDGRTVLQRTLDDASLAARFKLDLAAVPVKLSACQAALLAARAQRVRPATDDKILSGWNGLMLAAFAEAARVLSPIVIASEAKQSPRPNEKIASGVVRPRNDIYYKVATRSGEFLLTNLQPEGHLRRAWRDGKATSEVFLEDYAALIIGLLELYQTDFNTKWFEAARHLADQMIARFQDPEGGFFDTPQDGETLLIRPKELQDNATPSGNALACEALLKLAAFTDKGLYRELAERSLTLAAESALRYPTSFARWLSAANLAVAGIKQVAVVGEADDKGFKALIDALRSEYRPNMVVAACKYPPSQAAPALLVDRPLVKNKATAYVCEGFVCRQPVTSADELEQQL